MSKSNKHQHPITRYMRRKANSGNGSGFHKVKSNRKDRRTAKQALRSEYLD